MTDASLLGRVTAFVSRLAFRGLLEGCKVAGVHRGAGRAHLSLVWSLPETPAGTYDAGVTVDLPDDEAEAEWVQRLLHSLTDTAGHELGDAVRLDGLPVRRFAPVRGEA